MSSMIELNDTLQITAEQGFPADLLNIDQHLANPYDINEVAGKTFAFKDKPAIRVYQQPPVRCSLVQSVMVGGQQKWIYWGMCVIVETTHDNINKTTSGKYKIVYLNTPEEMKMYFKVHDGRPAFDYFAEN